MNPNKRAPHVILLTILVYFFLYAPIFVLVTYSFNASKTNIVFTGVITQFGDLKLVDGNVMQSPCGPFHWFCELG